MTPRHITWRDKRNTIGAQPELDSDRNEDPGREMQLDRSFDDWVMNTISDQTQQQHLITHVPNDNVFDVAEDMEEG